MKKIINDPKNVVDEMVDGLVRAYPQYLTKLPDTEAMVRSDQDSMQGKVGIVSGGGSGHEPAHAGFVGPGMLSAAVAGQVFTSPTPDQIYAAIKAVDQGKGVFLVVKNYSGDVMNFDMAKDMAELDDIQVKSMTLLLRIVYILRVVAGLPALSLCIRYLGRPRIKALIWMI